MKNAEFKLIIWFSLIIIALAVASIDVMMSKINELNPSNEPVVTNIVFNDVWYKISIVLFLVPALFSYYVDKSLRKVIFIIIAGLALIFFGLEDVLYFSIKAVLIPNRAYTFKVASFNLMPESMPWLSNNVFISIFGRPVTPYVLFESTAFALVASLILVLI
jgi:hypothetical protein